MYNYRSILTRVGIVLIAVGILEFVYFLYNSTLDDPKCILSNPSPNSSFSSSSSTFLVALGVFFLRGNLQIVSPLTWFAAFSLPSLVIGLVRLPFLFPGEFWGIAFRIDPIRYFMPTLVKIIGIAVALWIYTQLRAAPLVSACVRAGHCTTTPPKLAFILGIALVVVPLSIRYFYFTPDSVAEAQAVEVARTEYGEGYKYHVRAVRQYDGQMRACVDAYNEQEIKLVRVEWEQ
ncbi:MAG: hypothetical protein F6K14_32025 [Symploca sp. SIO2C1]|nr:hypothetical protein [Symploca sp. SIO2C1]